MVDPHDINRTLEYLQPDFRMRVEDLLIDLDMIMPNHNWQIFEAYRHPARQEWLFENTTATKAGPWESAHQYGLAVDLVPRPSGKWTWDEGIHWGLMKKAAVSHGLLVPISWDRAHVVDVRWAKVQRAVRR
jgi:hypothetical protein